MHIKVRITSLLLILSLVQVATAQVSIEQQQAKALDENAFTFSESQIDEDANSAQDVTILNSSSNVYASEVGYLFSPVRFRYRAFGQKYNEIYINGAPVNDVERGQFSYSSIGGLNQITRNVEFSLPFETSNFAMSGMAGSNNYDFRSGNMRTGNRVSLGGANRNYVARAMYTYSSGFNKQGWSFTGNLTYRWAERGYVEGTFYNSLSYFLGAQKLINDQHSLSFSTWGNPTERASQGAATDESFWLANDYQYNPYWGYQDGKRRNSRVVHDFAPSALLTWDWTINDKNKLTTTFLGKYGMYKSTKLNYNNTDNPAPDYWKTLPSNFYDVFNTGNTALRNDYNYDDWETAVDYFKSSKANRQINWDRLYSANRSMNAAGKDAMYYVQARHNNNLYLTFASTFAQKKSEKTNWNAGVVGQYNKGLHYQTMDDLLGSTSFHNVNTYAIGNYAPTSSTVQYDLNHPNAIVKEGDRFAYDYNIYTHRGWIWANYATSVDHFRFAVNGKFGGTMIERDGKMRNGLFPNNSYGKSGKAKFGEGGAKGSITYDTGSGHIFLIGAGYQWNAPLPNVAFQAAEMNNDFVLNLKDERVFSSEFAYQFNTSWLRANLNAYYSHMDHVTEWTCFYFDDINSFSYNSLTGLKKENYGLELGLDFKLTSYLDLKAIGQLSQAHNTSNARVSYLNSTEGTYSSDEARVKDLHEDGTPLSCASLGLDFHQGGWFVTLSGNMYDRIYLDYSPYYRYESNIKKLEGIYGEEYNLKQSKGHGGFMLDGSIGKNINLKYGSLSINLMVTNILNNQKIVTGGYEQSRSDFTSSGNSRGYSFSRNPKKYHVFGTNGMLQVSYRF